MSGSQALSSIVNSGFLLGRGNLAFVSPPKVNHGKISTLEADKIKPLDGGGHNSLLGIDIKPQDSRFPQANNRIGSTALKDSKFNLDGLFDFMGPNKDDHKVTITFKDVAGVDEAKFELQEVVEFLKAPDKFTQMGAVIPRGVLLEGPPGTGKTLLAKAVAGEAGVPFFAASGSEFVNMFVGKGAANVRDLFKKAQRESPAIIFIDEIDAIGKSRSNGFEGDSGERASTLNELLTQMDGFNTDTKVIVIAATNRADVLDSALVRAGRFDRQVTVGLADRVGRESILRVHARNKPLSDDFDFAEVARRTPGFSGADLANLMNEAAIMAVRDNLPKITTELANETIDRVIAGPKKIKNFITEERKKLVAYHEAGHALVGTLLPEFDNVQRVSIIPRGNAAGLTWFVPSDESADSGLYTYAYLKNNIAVTLGGRIAEEMIFGREGVTTGASNDLERVTQIARQIVKVFAMGDTVQMNLEPHKESAFVRSYSDDVANRLDAQVEELVKEAFDKAYEVLEENRATLDFIAQRLMKNEVMDGAELREIVSGRRDFTEEDALRLEKITRKQEEKKSSNEDLDGSSPMESTGISPTVVKENQVSKMMEALRDALLRL